MIIPEKTKLIRTEKGSDGKCYAVFVGEDGKEFDRTRVLDGFWMTESILCDCSTEALIVELLEDDADMAFLSVFDIGRKMPATFWQRMRQAWKVIWTGRPYGDQLCFSIQKMETLCSAAGRAATLMKEWKAKADRTPKPQEKPQ